MGSRSPISSHQSAPEPPVPDDGDMDDLLSRVGDAEDLDGLAAGARQDDDTRPPAVRYRATSHGLVWEKPTKDGPTDVLLTNFTATITAEITEDDGAELAAPLCAGSPAQREDATVCEILATQFAGMSWVAEHLGAMAIVMPGMTLKDHARAAIQLLSHADRAPPCLYPSRLAQLGEDWCYLHAGGAIGAHGAVPEVTVRPGEALAVYHLPAPPDRGAARAAIRASLRVLDVAEDAVTIPGYATVWRAVLGQRRFQRAFGGPHGTGQDRTRRPPPATLGRRDGCAAFTGLLEFDGQCPGGHCLSGQRCCVGGG